MSHIYVSAANSKLAISEQATPLQRKYVSHIASTYRTKRIAGYMRVGDVICIDAQVAAENKCTSVILSYRTCVSYVYEVAMQKNARSLDPIMTEIQTANSGFCNFHKGTDVLNEGI